MIPGSPGTDALRHLLTGLADTRHTGALHVDGAPGGTFYLAAGRITYADSPASPGIGSRLVGSGRLAEQTWRQAYEQGYAARQVGALLVRQGHLVQGELVCRVLAGTCDAAQAILLGDARQVHFVADERHWLGQVTQLELTALAREMARRLAAVAGTAAVVVREPATPPTNELPLRRADARAPNAGPPGDGANAPRFTPDYATLKRIRRTLKALD